MKSLDDKYNTLLEVVKECVKNGITVEIYYRPEEAFGDLAFRVNGFAKSGQALVFVSKETGNIEAHQRYAQVDFIDNFEDLAALCFSWCTLYDDYGFGEWAQVFSERGWIKLKSTRSEKWEIVK